MIERLMVKGLGFKIEGLRQKVKGKKGKAYTLCPTPQALRLIPYASCLIFSLFTFYFCYAQRMSAVIDREKILLGEQAIVSLKVEDVNPATQSLQWFSVPDSANHLEVIKKEKIDTIDINGLKTYLQKITITSFDSGRWALQMTPAQIKENNTGKNISLATDSLYLSVLPVDVSSLKDYHDIKEVIDVEVKDYTWWIVGGAIILAAILGYIIYRILKNRKPLPKVQKPVIKGPPLEWAMEQIALLEKENLPAQHKEKEFYSRLDEICRIYMDEKAGTNTLHSTADEVMLIAKLYLPEENKRTDFYQLLRLMSAVKFAKYIPSSTQNENAIITAKDTLQYVDRTMNVASFSKGAQKL